MAAAAILKNRKIAIISAAVRPISMKLGTVTSFDPLDRPTVKNLKFRKFKMARRPQDEMI